MFEVIREEVRGVSNDQGDRRGGEGCHTMFKGIVEEVRGVSHVQGDEKGEGHQPCSS